MIRHTTGNSRWVPSQHIAIPRKACTRRMYIVTDRDICLSVGAAILNPSLQHHGCGLDDRPYGGMSSRLIGHRLPYLRKGFTSRSNEKRSHIYKASMTEPLSISTHLGEMRKFSYSHLPLPSFSASSEGRWLIQRHRETKTILNSTNETFQHQHRCYGTEGVKSSVKDEYNNHIPLYTQPGEIEAHVQGENLKACRAVTLAGAATNIIYSILKIGAGGQGGSVALLADGIHAFVDFTGDIISYISVSLTYRHHPRSKFPFGLGRFETMGSLVIAVVLLATGTALFLSALQRFVSTYNAYMPSTAEPTNSAKEVNKPTCKVSGCRHTHSAAENDGILETILGLFACDHGDVVLSVTDEETGKMTIIWSMIAVSTSCLIAKQLLYRWARRVGEVAGSRIIVATAFHHRADSWTSAIALTGIVGQTMGFPLIDGVAGCIVSGLLTRTGATLFKNSILELFDYQNTDVRNLSEGVRYKIHSKADGVTCSVRTSERMKRVINVLSTRHGHLYAINATVLVDPKDTGFTAKELHEVQEVIREIAIKEHSVNLSSVSLSIVSVPPCDFTSVNYRDVHPNRNVGNCSSVGSNVVNREGSININIEGAQGDVQPLQPVSVSRMLKVLKTEGALKEESDNTGDLTNSNNMTNINSRVLDNDNNNNKPGEITENLSNTNTTNTYSNNAAITLSNYKTIVDAMTTISHFYGSSKFNFDDIIVDFVNKTVQVVEGSKTSGCLMRKVGNEDTSFCACYHIGCAPSSNSDKIEAPKMSPTPLAIDLQAVVQALGLKPLFLKEDENI